MKDIKFSFVVPVYNVKYYLKRCLDSILSQDYDNYEIICINDGSTDGSLAKLKEYAEHNNKIKIVSQENRGLGEARNTGVQYVTGDYIWFVDSDDWIEPSSLEKIVHFIEINGRKDMILFDTFKTDGLTKKVLKVAKNLSGISYQASDYIKELLKYDALFAAWIKVFKTKPYIDSKFQFQKGFYEDISLIHYYLNNIDNIGYVHAPLYNYFCRRDSIMKTYDERVLDAYKQFDFIYDPSKYEFSLYFQFFFYYLSMITYKRVSNTNSAIKCIFYDNYKKRKVGFGSVFNILVIEDIPLKRRLKTIYKIIKLQMSL